MAIFAILGAGGHAKVVADALRSCFEFAEVEFFSDGAAVGPIAGDTLDLLRSHHDFDGVVVGIGDNKIRSQKYLALKEAGARLRPVIHAAATVSPSANIGEGSVVLAGAVINADARVSANCIVNTSCIIEHDCVIGESVHVSPGAALGGNVSIGAFSWVGLGASIKNGLRIGSNVVVGAGGVVVSDVHEPGVYVGVPVKKLIKA